MKTPRGRRPSQRAEKAAARPMHELLAGVPLHAVAIHEAGHALVALLLGQGLVGVTILPRERPGGGYYWGYTDCPTTFDPINASEAAVVDYMARLLASGLAEEIRPDFSSAPAAGVRDDHALAESIAVLARCRCELDDRGRVVPKPGEMEANRSAMRSLFESARTRALSLLRGHDRALEAIASALLDRKSLSSEEVGAIVRKSTDGAISGMDGEL